MARFELNPLLFCLAGLAAGCTFTGLGDYDVAVCTRPIGTTEVQQVGDLGATADLTFTSASGKTAIGAFTASVNGGTCIEAVGEKGFLHTGCSFLGSELSLVPRQPSIVPLGAGHAAALVATTAPCTQGQLLYRFNAPGVEARLEAPCESTGAALPAVATANTRAAVAWYSTALATRTDPIGACGSAKPAPLQVAFVEDPAIAAAKISAALTLSPSGTSVRPPALLGVASGVVVVAPHAEDVGVWLVNGVLSPPSPKTISALRDARAVAAAVSPDERIAIAAEIGCGAHRIALAVGSLAAGFGQAVDVAPPDANLAIAPSVSWSGNGWIVAWVSTSGGAHALARRFDANGSPTGEIIDPALPAIGASATANGDLLAFKPASKSFVSTSLGCAR